jgi:putative restriction endonuclease
LRVSEAWEFFGPGNGVASLAEMRLRVGRYRRQPIATDEDPTIGCVFIRDTRFFAVDTIADPPRDFAPNIVQGKGYDLALPNIADEFAPLTTRLLGAEVEVNLSEP